MSVPTEKPNATKYTLVVDELRKQIASGKLPPGERMPTFAEMRARFDLAQNTVNRVFTTLEHDGLIVRRQGLGIFVTEKSKPKTTGGIGVTVNDNILNHPYYTHILKGVQSAARQAGWDVLLMHQRPNLPWEKIDGVLTMNDQIMFGAPAGLPRVAILRDVHNMPNVLSDDYQAMSAVMQHLLDLGHKRIGFMTIAHHADADVLSLQRYACYKDSLRAAGIGFDPNLIRDLRAADEGIVPIKKLAYEKMIAWLRNDWARNSCTAILAQNDESAISIIEALHNACLRVPEDVSVVGFDGTEIATHFRPRLTTVQVPLDDIGAAAANFLIEQIQERHEHPGESSATHQTLTLPARFIVGDSTGVAAC